MTAMKTVERCFQEALEVEVDEKGNAQITKTLPAADSRGVVYVAVRADGKALQVGMTRGKLKTRLDGIVDTINGKRRLKHEVQAQGWWLDAVRGKGFSVWCKKPSDLMVTVEDEPPHPVRSFHMEEAYWASVFKPMIGMKLSSRSKSRNA